MLTIKATYSSWPWIRDSSLIRHPLIVGTISVSIWAKEHSPHVTHAIHAHRRALEDVARREEKENWLDL